MSKSKPRNPGSSKPSNKDNKNNKPTAAQFRALKTTQPGSVKPTEAFVKPGQKPTGLAARDPKVSATPILRRHEQRTYDTLNAIGKFTTESTAFALGGGALVRGATKLAAKAAGRYVGNMAAESALAQNMKGLTTATGAGGRVSRTTTPMGPTLRSTSIGTAKQQAARINNLVTAAETKATRGGIVAGRQTMRDVLNVGKAVKGVGGNIGGAYIVRRNRPKK